MQLKMSYSTLKARIDNYNILLDNKFLNFKYNEIS